MPMKCQKLQINFKKTNSKIQTSLGSPSVYDRWEDITFKKFQSNKNKREKNSASRQKMKDLWLFLTILETIMWKTLCKYLLEIYV